jgi:hypothetical protein
MFESRPNFYWNWQKTAAVVIALLALLQYFRANRPRHASADTPAPPRYTTGTIVDAPVGLAPHQFVSYNVDFNRRTNLRGEFQTGDVKVRVECLLLDAANYEAWRASSDNKRISATGYVPGGKVIRVLEPGTYYIVISNRDGADSDKEKTVNANFVAE